MKAQPTRQRARTSHHLLWLLAVLISFVTFGCTIEVEESPEPTTCDEPQPIKGINPSTGECEWTTTCDSEDWAPCGSETYECSEIPADLCALDDRCEPVTSQLCPGCDPSTNEACPPCSTEEYCAERPSGCDTLDETSCAQSPECYPEYGWTGSAEPITTEPNGGSDDEDVDGGAPSTDAAPYPSDPPTDTWAFIGCFEVPSGPCEGLDEQSCIQTRECAPVYETSLCDCAPPYDENGDGLEDWACNCADVEGFAGCEWIPTTPDDCFNAYDPNECEDLPGCSWVEEGGGDREAPPTTEPCLCDGVTDSDCACVDPAQPAYIGYCTPDAPDSCYDIADPNACYSMPGCTWYEESYPGETPIVDCLCDDGTDNCDCGAPAAPYIDGRCGPEEVPPPTCWDHYDPNQCLNSGCEWVNEGGVDLPEPPPPCECAPGELCDCDTGGAQEPYYGYCQPPQTNGCWDYYDEFSCASNPECEWSPEGGPYPEPDYCGCAIDEPNCDCAAPIPMPYPGGFCHERIQQGCDGYYDEFSCASSPECEWTAIDGGGFAPPLCDCIEGDPTCVCAEPPPAEGFCQDNSITPNGCWDYYDEFSCTSNPGCGWGTETGGGIAYPAECLGLDTRWDESTGLCFSADGQEADPICCEMGDVIDIGYCYEVEPPNDCSAIDQIDACAASGCTWEELAVPCFCEDPDLGCECPTVGVCR